MNLKPISNKTWLQFKSLKDGKLNRRLVWLIHTGYISFINDDEYQLKVTIQRNIAQIKTFRIKNNELEEL